MTCLLLLGVVTLLTVEPRSSTAQCQRVCNEGKYCNGTNCLDCPIGFYIDKNAHKETNCKPWTKVSGRGWKNSANGTNTTDSQWECDSGLSLFNNTDCVEEIKLDSPIYWVRSAGIALGIFAFVLIVVLIVWILKYRKPVCSKTSQALDDGWYEMKELSPFIPITLETERNEAATSSDSQTTVEMEAKSVKILPMIGETSSKKSSPKPETN